MFWRVWSVTAGWLGSSVGSATQCSTVWKYGLEKWPDDDVSALSVESFWHQFKTDLSSNYSIFRNLMELAVVSITYAKKIALTTVW